jgi:hypothetical protein
LGRRLAKLASQPTQEAHACLPVAHVPLGYASGHLPGDREPS